LKPGKIHEAAAIVSTSLIAALVPPIITVGYFLVAILVSGANEFGFLFLILFVSLIVSLLHVVFLALPGLLLLNRFGQLKSWTVALLGCVGGSVPFGVWTWPVSHHGDGYSYWNGSDIVQAKIDGVPTTIGWLSYAKGVGGMGLLGILTAVAFWFLLTKARVKQLPKIGCKSTTPQ